MRLTENDYIKIYTGTKRLGSCKNATEIIAKGYNVSPGYITKIKDIFTVVQRGGKLPESYRVQKSIVKAARKYFKNNPTKADTENKATEDLTSILKQVVAELRELNYRLDNLQR